MGQIGFRTLGGCLIAAGFILAVPCAQATTYYNLTNLDAFSVSDTTYYKAEINGGIFTSNVSTEVVGTGVLAPFVRIQQTGNGRCTKEPCIESGYNTDGFEEFETKDNGGSNWNHSLLLSNVGTELIEGVLYRNFILDINESNTDTDRFLSLDKFKIYLSSVGNLDNYTESAPDATPGAPDTLTSQDGLTVATKIFDIDFTAAGVNTNSSLGLNYNLNSGSGKGIDMIAHIPDANFKDANGNYIAPYVYLYSSFGATGDITYKQTGGQAGAIQYDNTTNLNTNNPAGNRNSTPGLLPAGNYAQSAGFEEWSTRIGGAVPEPMSVALLLIGLAAIGFVRRQQPSPIAC